MSTNELNSTTELKVEVWTDIVCPFCYVGEKRLRDAAASLSADVKVTITPRAFELSPDAEGVQHVRDHLVAKFGDASRVEQMDAQVGALAVAEGLPYTGDRLTSNTLTAHRLIAAAREEASLGLEVLHEIQRGHFDGSLDLSNEEQLIAAAVAAGFAESRAREVVAGTEYTDQVRADEATAQSFGVTGVPFTVINRRYAVPGSVAVEQFQAALQQALQDK